MKKKFIVHGYDCGEGKKFSTLKQAIECCEHMHKKGQRRCYTKVMQEINGKMVKVYPIKRKEIT